MRARSFAVVPSPLKRETATSPLSASWTLYDPGKLAAELGLSVDVVNAALERTGFNKAVRIREEVIRWKERMRNEERSLMADLDAVNKQRRNLQSRLAIVREQLVNLRNMLRIPREAPQPAHSGEPS